MYRILFRLLCVLLLLVGQEAALTHALSHTQGRLARSAPVTAADTGSAQHGKSTGDRYALCDFDYAYSQVLGAVQAKAPACPTSNAAHALNAIHEPATRVARFFSPYSRGPPHHS